ncbi:MAG: YbaB/EbfC family nucleoid-associated protein [Spirochaetales bacterium]|nr:YbaB/EbfC family nucleoid-associated protein [Spirochaetales bacterium]
MNPMDFLKNLQNMQSQMGEIQERMKSIQVSGSAGGGMVSVELNGAMSVKKVSIAPEVVDPEDVGMLEDLVLAAFTDALTNLRDRMQGEMSSLTGGLNLPPNMFGL